MADEIISMNNLSSLILIWDIKYFKYCDWFSDNNQVICYYEYEFNNSWVVQSS